MCTNVVKYTILKLEKNMLPLSVHLCRLTVSRNFLLKFFTYESFSPKPLKITIGSFQIFEKIRGDNRKSRCTTSINDTNFAASSAFGVDTGDNFATGVNDTGGKFVIGVNDTGGKFPPVSTTPTVNLPPVPTTPRQTMGTISDG